MLERVKVDQIEGLLAFEEMNGLEHEPKNMHTESVRRPSRIILVESREASMSFLGLVSKGHFTLHRPPRPNISIRAISTS